MPEKIITKITEREGDVRRMGNQIQNFD